MGCQVGRGISLRNNFRRYWPAGASSCVVLQECCSSCDGCIEQVLWCDVGWQSTAHTLRKVGCIVRGAACVPSPASPPTSITTWECCPITTATALHAQAWPRLSPVLLLTLLVRAEAGMPHMCV
jgi:hypothetical protein